MLDASSLNELRAAADGLIDHLGNGHTLGQLMGTTLESREALYQLAYRLYGQGKYEEAQRMFAVLLLHDHTDRRFYLAYGACAHMLKRHAVALRYYGMASLLNLTDPQPLIHMAECQLVLGDRGKARQVLDYGLAQARFHPEHHHHVPKLEALLFLLDRAESTPVDRTASTPTSTTPNRASP